MTTQFPRLALWEIACNAPGTKIDSHRARYFPLGLPVLGAGGHVVRRVNSVSRFTRSSRPSNRNSPCSKRSIHGIRLHRLLRKSPANDYLNWRNGVPREDPSKTDGLGSAHRWLGFAAIVFSCLL